MPAPVLQLRESSSRALDYVANQELKGLSYVALDSIGIGTRTEVAEAVNDATGIITTGLTKSYPDTFSRYGFAETITDVGRNGRQATFFGPVDKEIALPVIGATLGWSIDHPQHSLNEVLSTSSSKGSAAPTNSIQIFDGLLRGLNIGEMDLPGYVRTAENWSTAHTTRLKTLVTRGLVEIAEDENRYRILTPEYRGSRPFDSLKPATQAAYHVLSLAKLTEPDKKWTTAELVALAEKNQLILPEDVQALDEILDNFASKATPAYGSGSIEKIDFVGRVYYLSPTYADVISKLVDTVASLNDGGTRTQKKHTDTARELFGNPEQARVLAEKAITNSPYAKK